MALAHEHGTGWLGVQEGDRGPFPRFLENWLFAGKKLAASGVRVGSSRGLVWLEQSRQVLPQRGMTFAHHSGKVIRPGSTISIMAPGVTRQRTQH